MLTFSEKRIAHYTYKFILSRSIKGTLIQFLVISQVDYCPVTYFDLTEDSTKHLQRIENVCVRFERLSHYYTKLGWSFRTTPSTCSKLIFKLVTTRKPSYLSSRFTFLSDINSLQHSPQREETHSQCKHIYQITTQTPSL